MTRHQRHTVGIFSRDGEDNYKWLINLLRTGMFQSVVELVLPIYISNTARNFNRGLNESSFAIVYHTKKRGRLNIANVTDSLYDEELEELSRHLGRRNVIVLVDDLEDSSDSNMRRILQEQRLDVSVCELMLISEREKESSNLSGEDPKFIQSPISAQMQDAYNMLYDKLRNLKSILEDAPHNNAGPHNMDTCDWTSDSYNSMSKGKSLQDVEQQHVFSISGRTALLGTSSDDSHDDDRVRSSHHSVSDMRSDNQKSLLDGNNYPPANCLIPRDNIDQQAQGVKKKDKLVFGIIAALIAVLVVALIIVLSVGL
ncbi:uncharacterized protein [Eleutherodactylus coqui]|uniref:uncharacterized protein isoform X2 n=1 Tax=Eleutherodactylus coqui TaxID=57060 RepID=UPI003461CA7F